MPKNKASKPRNIIVATANITPAAAAIIAASKAPAPVAPPVKPLGTDAANQAPRSNVAAVTKAPPVAAVITPPPATDAPPAPAKPSASLSRDAAGINGATDFATFTARDEQYLRFFGTVARANGDRCTVAQLYAAGVARPGKHPSLHYIPGTTNSTKATDRDAYDRLAVAGYLTVTGDADNADKRTLSPTAKALASSLYTGK